MFQALAMVDENNPQYAGYLKRTLITDLVEGEPNIQRVLSFLVVLSVLQQYIYDGMVSDFHRYRLFHFEAHCAYYAWTLLGSRQRASTQQDIHTIIQVN